MKLIQQRLSFLEKRVGIRESFEKLNGNRIIVYDNNDPITPISVLFLDFETEFPNEYKAIVSTRSGYEEYYETSLSKGDFPGKQIPFKSLSPYLQSRIRRELK